MGLDQISIVSNNNKMVDFRKDVRRFPNLKDNSDKMVKNVTRIEEEHKM